MKTFLQIGLLSLLFIISSCEKPCWEEEKACTLAPDPGMCLAAIPRYYYDQDEGKCKQFIWGGCGGTVPFETLAECEGKCSCEE